MGLRVVVVALATALSVAAATAPGPAVTRLFTSVDEFDQRVANVAGEERYVQRVEPGGHTRTLRSDYALVRDPARDAWVGYRDTFEVDGQPVRDREDRLQRLLAAGALAQAAQIANESARFNIGTDVIVRNINVPTLVLQLLGRDTRERFSFTARALDVARGGGRLWRIDYRERGRPTIVRTPDGRDRRSRGSVFLNEATGDIVGTTIVWDDVHSSMSMEFERVDAIDAVVPVGMAERYERKGVAITGDATYSNFRQFQTAARVVAPQ